MAKDRAPSFQFYPSDFLADPAVMSMTLEARGAYITLLCAAWGQKSAGVLPDDDEWLARASGANGKWGVIRDMVRAAFRKGNGTLIQKRMQQEREAQRRRYQQAKSGADKTNALKDLTRTATRTAVAPSSSIESLNLESNPLTPNPTVPQTTSSAPAPSDESDTPSPAPNGSASSDGFTLALKDGSTWHAPDALLAKLREAFPAVDLDAEFARMRSWLEANPGKRKTLRGAPRFVQGWCSRAKPQPPEPEVPWETVTTNGVTVSTRLVGGRREFREVHP